MKIKKLLAGLTALCCLGCVPLHANAVQYATQEQAFFIVNDPDSNIMDYYYHVNDSLQHTLVDLSEIIEPGYYAYGDVLYVDGAYEIGETYPAKPVLFGGAGIPKAGTCRELFETKTLTIIGGGVMRVYPADGSTNHRNIGRFELEDEEGNHYSYTQDYDYATYAVDLENAQVGESYSFAVYNDTVLLPENEEEIIIENVHDFVIVGVDNQENPTDFVLSNHETGYTYYVSKEDMLPYIKRDNDLQLGDSVCFEGIRWIVPPLEATNRMEILDSPDGLITKSETYLEYNSGAYFTVGNQFSDFGVYLDRNGKTYILFTDWQDKYQTMSSLDLSTIKKGDTLICKTYNNYPVIAVEQTDSGSSFAVVGVNNAENPESYVLADSSGNTWIIQDKDIQPYFSRKLTIGDVITMQGIEYTRTNIIGTNWIEVLPESAPGTPGYNAFTSESILKHPRKAEFTVSEITYENTEGNAFAQLTDENGKNYTLFTDWLVSGSAQQDNYLDWNTVKTGDTVECILFDGYPVIGTQITSAENSSEETSESETEAVTEEITGVSGDADGNGKLDILDVIYVNRVILGRDTLPKETVPLIDFNQDGVPDSSDALTMLKMIVGLT